MRRRILHVLYSFAVGGSEAVVLDLVGALPEFDHAVAAIELGGPLKKEFESLGAATCEIAREGRGVAGPMYRVWRAISQLQPDIVHTHHGHELVYSALPAFFRRLPLIHTEHEHYSTQADKPAKRLKLLSRFCSVVTAVNQETARHLVSHIGISEGKVETIANGIDVDRFTTEASDRRSLDLADDDLVIGTVARLDTVKNQKLLLSAFASVLSTHPAAALLIVGDGPERTNLEQECARLGIERRVRFLGMRRDIPRLLAVMDVFVLTSSAEGLPMSILEAMAAGTAVVSTGVGGIPAVVRDGETGLLVNAGSQAGLESALVKVLDSHDLRERLSRNAHQLVVDTYALSHSVAQYRRLYDRVIGRRR